MIKIEIPYKNHINKQIWDYITQVCGQLNNINRAEDLSQPEASVENVLYLVFDKHYSGAMQLSALVSLSNMVQNGEETKYQPYCNIVAPLKNCEFSGYETDLKVFSFDIKKYNSVLSFSENYQNRDKITFYIDEDNNTLNYRLYNDEYILLSPIYVSKSTAEDIGGILRNYNHGSQLVVTDDDFVMSVDSVDKNSYLLPFMAYKDFLNFAVHSSDSRLFVDCGSGHIYNELVQDGEIKFYLKTNLREDKFHSLLDSEKGGFFISPALWQVLVILQNYKMWDRLNICIYHSNDKVRSFASLIFKLGNEEAEIAHIFNPYSATEKYNWIEPDDNTYQLVGKIHSDELHRLNKLYSNANRTCYFDFSTQTFSGNNYAFNDNKLEVKTVKLENDLSESVTLPLRITFTEIKHYVGSDLSQKNFILQIYTDGIRVKIERINAETQEVECVLIFNHEMSKKNQKLSI